MNARDRARQNIKDDFDQDVAVDLLCAKIDELEEALQTAEDRLKAPEIMSYEEMAARHYSHMEECAGKLRAAEARIKQARHDTAKEDMEVMNALSEGLDYEYEEGYGYPTGEHVPATLALVARGEMIRQRERIEELTEALERIAEEFSDTGDGVELAQTEEQRIYLRQIEGVAREALAKPSSDSTEGEAG